MKANCFRIWPVLAAGLLIAPLCAQSPARPERPETTREAPKPERIQAAVRQMAELHKAGKHEEARKLSQRLREAAKGNPQVARQVFQAMREQRQPRPEAAKPGAAPRPMARPGMPPGAPPRGMVRPNVPPTGQPPAQAVRPHTPPPRPPMARPDAAASGQVAKMRHLKQAAVHLAAAGYGEQAAKAREEAGRLEAALKQAQAKPARPPQAQSREPRRERHGQAKPQPAAEKAEKAEKKDKEKDKADADTAVLKEIRKLGKQVEDLGARVKKLEKAKGSDDD